MFLEDKDSLSNLLRNPLEIQNRAISEIEDRSNGKYVIADSNSAFCNLLEFGSSISAACMQEIDNIVVPGMYAKRAQNFKSLSRHMSDFDYVNLFGTPAHTTIGLQLDTITLFDQAQDYNQYYKKAVIPVESVFHIGNYNFGIYYPIEIQINKFNQNILVIYNVEEEHPLHKLTVNTLEYRTQTMQGVPLLSFTFPVYQFSRSYLEETVITSTGFSKSYTYNDIFYACRVFTWIPTTKTWKELSQTTSDILYDPNEVTAKISIEPDVHKFNINIPQIYFDSGKMGSKIMIELYTTQGQLDLDISNYPSEAFTASFFDRHARKQDPFATIFKKFPSLQIFPVATKIVGGNNGHDFNEARTRVINNISHRSLLITPTDITKYFEDNQFKVTKHLDNISNRIYFCNGTLTDSDGSYIPVTNSYTKITEDIVDSTSDIRRNQSSSVTILPTALYRYIAGNNYCQILSDEEKKALDVMTKEEFVNELNSVAYTKSPFHVVVDLPPARYQKATTYNLFSTEVKGIQFKYDHSEIMAQMVGYAATINHDKDGSDGYTIRFVVGKTDDLKELSEEMLQVYVVVKDKLGAWCGRVAEYIGMQGDFHVYEMKLTTDYRLEDHCINITNIDFEHKTNGHLIPLETDWYVIYGVNQDMAPGIENDYRIVEGAPRTFTDTYIGMGRQIFTLHLGHSLDDIIYNICDFTWQKQEYKKYDYTVYKTYPSDVYETKSDGTLVTEIIDGQVKLNKIHSAGDPVLDDEGEPIVEHAPGDYLRDPQGNLILDTNRTYECLVYMMQVDARMYMSENPVHQNFITSLPNTLESYFSTIDGAKAKILEQTELYYRPVRTIGNAEFYIGDGRTTIQQLDISFRMKLYVPPFIKNNEEQQKQIRENIITITETAIASDKISMTDIAALIKNKLSTYIDNIDVLGINGDKELQTIHVMDDDAQCSVARVLTILKDGSISLDKDIALEFAATEQTILT